MRFPKFIQTFTWLHNHNRWKVTSPFSPLRFPHLCTVENPRLHAQEHAQKGYEATKERVSTYQKGQELLDKGGVDGWSRWESMVTVGCSVFFLKKGKIWVMKNWSLEFRFIQRETTICWWILMVWLAVPLFDGLIDGNGTWFSGKLKPFCF